MPTLLLFILCGSILSVLCNVDCITTVSDPSGPGDENIASISCPSSHQTLTSCGFSTLIEFEGDYDGSYNSNNTCHARNGYQPIMQYGEVYAHARCCNLTAYNVECTGILSDPSIYSGSSFQSESCPFSHKYLLGCSVLGNYPEGSFPGTIPPTDPSIEYEMNYPIQSYSSCSGQESPRLGGGTIQSALSCCRTLTHSFECIVRYGKPSGDDKLSTIDCPDGYFMAGCSGYGLDANTNAVYIQNDTCYARSDETFYPSYSTAICCQILPTLNPSMMPTIANEAWTSEPSNHPAMNPLNDGKISQHSSTEFIKDGKDGNLNDENIEFWTIIGVVGSIGFFMLFCFCVMIIYKVRKENKKRTNNEGGVNMELTSVQSVSFPSNKSNVVEIEGVSGVDIMQNAEHSTSDDILKYKETLNGNNDDNQNIIYNITSPKGEELNDTEFINNDNIKHDEFIISSDDVITPKGNCNVQNNEQFKLVD